VRLAAELLPARLRHLHAELLRGGLDVLEGLFALFVGDVLHLVEAGDGVAHMRGVVQRLLALRGKRVGGVAHLVALFGRKASGVSCDWDLCVVAIERLLCSAGVINIRHGQPAALAWRSVLPARGLLAHVEWLVGRRAVEPGHGNVVEAQIDAELGAMVDEVVEDISAGKRASAGCWR
jgi:hypothetical protein